MPEAHRYGETSRDRAAWPRLRLDAYGLISLEGPLWGRSFAMPATVSFATRLRPLVLLGLLFALLTAITVGLWTFYGTTVFFEIVRTGWVSCF